mgnify:CR=1 FL=1
MRQLFHFASDTCAGCILPWSLSRPSCSDEQLRGGDLARHLGEPQLDRLRRRERPAEQLARLGVVDQLREAGLRRADHAPGDAVARLREAGQRTLEALHARQQVRFRHARRCRRTAPR